MNDAFDPLEPLLTPAAAAQPAFRAELRTRTSHFLRRQRRLRWLPGIVACAACLLLVFGIAWWFLARLARVEQGEMAKPAPPRQEAPPPPPAPASGPTAVALEWQAFDSPLPQRRQRYLEAGNHYVEQAQDYESALRCYGQALAAGGEALEISPDDNWLVMALKIDQKQKGELR